jgi:hypothetical protein
MNNYIFENYVIEMKEIYLTTSADASNLRYLLESFYGLAQVHVEEILSTSKELIDQHLHNAWLRASKVELRYKEGEE